MQRLFAWAVGVSVCVACGGGSDTAGDAGDAAADVRGRPDAPVPDSSPPPYQTQGVRCVASDAGAPLPWSPPPVGDAGALSDAATDGEAGLPPLNLHPPIMESSGGPVISNPIFVPMTFDGDDLRDPIEDFIASVGCTSYWRTIANDYGIGDGVTGDVVHLSDAAPTSIDDSAIAAYISQKVLASAIPAPLVNQTVYIIYYPSTTDITLQGEHSCQAFGGYHNELLVNNMRVPYAVIPRCQDDIDSVTGTSSHELLEATSDPLPMTDPAYQFPEPNGIAWALAGGGEIGDLCEMNQDAMFIPSDYPFTVQHGWTSHAAYAAQDPCQPSDNPYVAAAPVLPDIISLNFGAGAVQAQGVALALNNSKTIDLQLIASAPWAGAVTVDVQDAQHYFGGSPALTFALSTTSGLVGDTIQLTINHIGSSTIYGLAPFVIRATSLGVTRAWWATVGTP